MPSEPRDVGAGPPGAPVHFSDATLREGDQMPGSRLTPEDKVTIARELARLGVRSADVGFPAASEREREAVRRVAAEVPEIITTALCRTVRGDVDAAVDALSPADPERRVLTLFVATSPIHRERKLGITVDGLIDLVTDAVGYARARVPFVAFSAEDSSRTEPDVLAAVCDAALAAGASVFAYTDTLGIMTPEGIGGAITDLRTRSRRLDEAALAVHCHDDLGLAVANTLAGAAAGAAILQCTVNGVGERAGNAALEEVAMALALNPGQYGRAVTLDLSRLTPLSRMVAAATGASLAPHKSVTGANVFATAAGVHQDGLLKDLDTYLPFRPEMVGGDPVRLALGPSSGRAAIAARLDELGIGLSDAALGRVVAVAKEAPRERWDDADGLLRDAATRAERIEA